MFGRCAPAGGARPRVSWAGLRQVALALAVLGAFSVPAAAADPAAAREAAGWAESSPGLFLALP